MPIVKSYSSQRLLLMLIKNMGKNSRMSLDESVLSVVDFYAQLTKSSTGIDQHLYVYISGIVGVSERGRQEFGIIITHSIRNELFKHLMATNYPLHPYMVIQQGLVPLRTLKH